MKYMEYIRCLTRTKDISSKRARCLQPNAEQSRANLSLKLLAWVLLALWPLHVFMSNAQSNGPMHSAKMKISHGTDTHAHMYNIVKCMSACVCLVMSVSLLKLLLDCKQHDVFRMSLKARS